MDPAKEISAALAHSILSEPSSEADKRHCGNRRKRCQHKNKKEKEMEVQPFRFLDLPLDIRIMIYCYCYRRALMIAPGMCYYRRRLYRREIVDHLRWKKYSIFQYHWEGQDHFIPGIGSMQLPTKDGSLAGVLFSWRTTPTFEQEAIIASGSTILPNTSSQLPRSSDITHSIDYSEADHDTLYIANSQNHYIAGLVNISLLRTCKQTRAEGVEILYGENNFVFDVEGCHTWKAFDEEPERIPGIPDEHGNLPTKQQISRAIEQIFDRNLRHPRFIWYDPLIHFLTKIGRYNAALLKCIKIKGVFRTSQSNILGFCEIFPIYTLVLKQACTKLRKITPHMGSERQFLGHNLEGETGKTDEELIDDTMKALVEGLPDLQQLVLGDYEIPRSYHGQPIWDAPSLKPTVDEWGPLQNWAKIVNDRSQIQIFPLGKLGKSKSIGTVDEENGEIKPPFKTE